MGFLILIQIFPLALLFVLIVYVLLLSIKALNIYIKKNS